MTAHRASLPIAAVIFVLAPRSFAQTAPAPVTTSAPTPTEASSATATPANPPLANPEPGAAQPAALSTGPSFPLDAKTAASRAQVDAPSLIAAKSQEDAAQSQVRKAKQGWYPRLDLKARYSRYSPYEQPTIGPFVAAPSVDSGPVPPGTQLITASGSFPAFVNNYLLQAQLTVPISDYLLRTSENTKAANTSLEAARLRTEAQKQALARDAAFTFYAGARAELSLALARATLASSTTQLETVRALASVERASRVDLLTAEARRASAVRLVNDAEATLLRSERDLKIAARMPSDARPSRSEDLEQPLAPVALPPIEALYEEARTGRIELRATERDEESLTSQRKAVRRSAWPRVDLYGTAVYSNPNLRFLPPEEEWKGTWEVGAQLTFSPNDVADAEERGTALAVQQAQKRAERAQLEEAMRLDINAATEAVARADAAIEPTRLGRDAAVEAERARREAYTAGKGTLVEVQSAESDRVIAELEYLDALVGQRTSRIQLAHALGRRLDDPAHWPAP